MEQTKSPLSGKTVLLVEDDLDLRSAIHFDFKKRGCIVLEASGNKEALELLRHHKVDVVLSDIRMPGGNGVDLLTEIRKRHKSKPPVILMTAFSDISESEAINKGALGLLEKPLDRKRMFSIMENSVSPLPTA